MRQRQQPRDDAAPRIQDARWNVSLLAFDLNQGHRGRPVLILLK